MEWKDRAACRGKPTEWWFPLEGGDTSGLDARRVCAACPVQAECAQAGAAGEQGIWGGLSPTQHGRVTATDALRKAEHAALVDMERRKRRKAAADRARRALDHDPGKHAAKLAYLAEYRARNREKARNYRRSYYRNNVERTKEVNQAWRDRNPERVREYRARDNAKRRGRTG
jgi:hypothetical protein